MKLIVLPADVEAGGVDGEHAAGGDSCLAADDDRFFLLKVEQVAGIDVERLAIFAGKLDHRDQMSGIAGVGGAEGALFAGGVLMFVLLHLGDRFGVGEEEDRLAFSKGELGVGLVGRVRHAADRADHHDVHFVDSRVFAFERIGSGHRGVVFFRRVVLNAVAVVVVIFVGVGFAFMFMLMISVIVIRVIVVLVVGVLFVVVVSVFFVGRRGGRC